MYSTHEFNKRLNEYLEKATLFLEINLLRRKNLFNRFTDNFQIMRNRWVI